MDQEQAEQTVNRRTYLGTVVGITTITTVSGCLQGDAVLNKRRISATSPTKEWDVELEEGDEMRLEVDKTDGSGSVRGYVHRADTGEEIASAVSSGTDEKFDVPATGTYVVSVEVGGATGKIILRNLDS